MTVEAGASGSANVRRAAGSALIWQNFKSPLHHPPRPHRPPEMWNCRAAHPVTQSARFNHGG